jgi:L-alanine-DL-glutamate epimerase-like enolase superfamily enzyme
MTDATILCIEMGILEGTRPRHAGSNARLGVHGSTVRVPVVRITTADGASGFGRCGASAAVLEPLLGQDIDALVSTDGADPGCIPVEYPLLDLAATRAGQPVYRFIDPAMSAELLRVRAYDTTLYFDDLHLESDEEAVALIATEAREGLVAGHTAFKIKVGRGARHMPLERGTRRDIAIVQAVREAVGPDAPIMIDANNGYNLNLTKRVLSETRDAGIHWIEEPFHEDAVLYRDLREWRAREGLDVLVADGEGTADPALLEWAEEGLIDVVQYDIFSYGFTRWLALGARMDAIGVWSAPHNYGSVLGNYATGHLARRIEKLPWVEWDPADVPGIDASGYPIREGWIGIPDAPGFGLMLDADRFTAAVATNGFILTA